MENRCKCSLPNIISIGSLSCIFSAVGDLQILRYPKPNEEESAAVVDGLFA
jgi:hypothetical protein